AARPRRAADQGLIPGAARGEGGERDVPAGLHAEAADDGDGADPGGGAGDRVTRRIPALTRKGPAESRRAFAPYPAVGSGEDDLDRDHEDRGEHESRPERALDGAEELLTRARLVRRRRSHERIALDDREDDHEDDEHRDLRPQPRRREVDVIER